MRLEDRYVAVDRLGAPNEYAAVVTQYADLFSDPTSHLEALKRATFLAWCATAEPPEFTGLSAITAVHTHRILRELENELATRGGHLELRAMLRWYVRAAGGPPFCEAPDLVMLAQFVDEANADERETNDSWRPPTIEGRGQMGRYWGSLRDDACSQRQRGALCDCGAARLRSQLTYESLCSRTRRQTALQTIYPILPRCQLSTSKRSPKRT